MTKELDELVHEEQYFACDCGGTIIPAVQCEKCGEYCTEDELTDDTCDKCLSKHCNYENVLEMGIEYQENYEINGFLASVFDQIEVEAILMVTFERLPKNERDKYIKKYFNEDKEFALSWLKEQGKL